MPAAVSWLSLRLPRLAVESAGSEKAGNPCTVPCDSDEYKGTVAGSDPGGHPSCSPPMSGRDRRCDVGDSGSEPCTPAVSLALSRLLLDEWARRGPLCLGRVRRWSPFALSSGGERLSISLPGDSRFSSPSMSAWPMGSCMSLPSDSSVKLNIGRRTLVKTRSRVVWVRHVLKLATTACDEVRT